MKSDAWAGAETVLDHELLIDAKDYTPTNDELIPTGKIAPVAKTPLDFTRATRLGARIEPLLQTGAIGYDPSVPNYEFNLDKARQKMQASGVTTPLEVRMTVHSREQDVQQAQLIQQMVDKIGIKLNLEVVERVAWGEKVRIQNDFQMASRQSGVQVDPTDDLLVTWAEGGNSAYHRAHVPGLIDTLHQADAEYDTAKRQALFVEAQKLMYDSAWFGYIWFEPGNFLVHNRIQGFPATWGSLREAEWWIDSGA